MSKPSLGDVLVELGRKTEFCLPIKTFEVSEYFASTTSLQNTGVSWECPEEAIVFINAYADWMQTAPQAVGIASAVGELKSYSVHAVQYARTDGGSHGRLMCTGMIHASAGTKFYLYAKYPSTAQNMGGLVGFYIPL